MSTFAERDGLIAAFLKDAAWGDAALAPLAGDASTRRYLRLARPGPAGEERAVLMDAPPSAEKPACPPGASEAERAALGYNASARLAGPRVDAFAALAGHLRALGLSAPRILAADIASGLLLLEDLGDELYSRAVAAGAPEPELYTAAIEALARLHAAAPPERLESYDLLTYDRMAALTEAGLFADWYAARDGALPDSARADWDAVWAKTLASFPGGAVRTLTLRDFHADNLIWLPGRSGPARAGLLDFQDAVIGHPAYDLISLLEDARRDVDPRMAAFLTDVYLDLSQAPAEPFREAMAVWAAQRNAKILGIFVRLATRDGKLRYLDFLPRVERLFMNDLAHPALEGVRDWVGAHAPGVLKAAA